VTAGHRDEIEMRRVHKEAIWDPSYPAPPPIARRRARIPIPERCAHDGEVLLPLDEDAVRAGVRRLHALGWAHSVEVRNAEGTLVGGLYGVAIGGLFAGESMFHRERDASKVALVALVDLLSDEYAKRRLVDTQWQTPHLATLGVEEWPREEYLAALPTVLDTPLPAPWR
jgi:leucyl/phenylalanyl-tRNA--protein transferase